MGDVDPPDDWGKNCPYNIKGLCGGGECREDQHRCSKLKAFVSSKSVIVTRAGDREEPKTYFN